MPCPRSPMAPSVPHVAAVPWNPSPCSCCPGLAAVSWWHGHSALPPRLPCCFQDKPPCVVGQGLGGRIPFMNVDCAGMTGNGPLAWVPRSHKPSKTAGGLLPCLAPRPQGRPRFPSLGRCREDSGGLGRVGQTSADAPRCWGRTKALLPVVAAQKNELAQHPRRRLSKLKPSFKGISKAPLVDTTVNVLGSFWRCSC